jgi:hypothetical protein
MAKQKGLDTSNIEKGLSLEERRQRVLSNITQLREKEAAAIRNSSQLNEKQNNALKNNVKELKKINDILNEIHKSQKEQITNYKAAGDSISSMSELQEELKHHLAGAAKEGIKFAQSIDTAGAGTKDTFKKGGEYAADAITSIAEMAQLNKEDGVAIAAKAAEIAYYTDQLKAQINVLDANLNALSIEEKALLDNLIAQRDTITEQTKEAARFASMSKDTKALYEELNEDLEGIKKTFKKMTTTAEVFFSSTRNMVGMTLFAAGELAHKFHEVGREMGYGLTEAKGFKSQMLIAGILSEESAEAVKELGKELGDTSHISSGMAADAAMLAYHYKLSGEQAAYLSTAFGEMQGQSWQTGQNTLKYVGALAAANGVMPGEAMKDIANNSEFLAKFTKDGGKNIGDAAIAAAKLGVNLGVAEKMADSLLDYQSSIDAEMEASVLLGRSLNLGKARELAYNGDIEGSMKAALEAAGGIEEFGNMDYYQKQAVAKALGVSVGEMQKMVSHEETLAGKHGVAAQQYERMSNLMHVIGDSIAGKVLKGMGGLVLSGAKLSSQMTTIGKTMPGLQKAFGLLAKPFDFLIGKVADFVGMIGNAIAKMFAMKAAQSSLDTGTSIAEEAGSEIKDKATDAVKDKLGGIAEDKLSGAATPAADGGAEQANKFGKIKSGDLIKGAAALLILAVALYVSAKAFQEFANVTWSAVGMGLVGLAGMAAVAFALSKVQGEMIKGAIAVAILGVALIPFAYAMSLIAGLEIGAVIAAAAGLIIFGAAVFGLGALMFTGAGAMLFGAGLLALVGLGFALTVLGEGLVEVGSGITAIGTGLPMVSQHIAGLIAIIPQILQLADAFNTLTISLMGLGIASMLAGPMLKNINLNTTMGGDSGGKGESSSDKLLAEIVGLRTDLNSGKVAVYLDGKKVNTGLNISNLRNKT